MTDRRNFIKKSLLAGISMAVAPNILKATESMTSGALGTDTLWKYSKRKKVAHWLWISPKESDDVSMLNERYGKYFKAGIRGILFGKDSEKHFRAAKAQGIEAHRWIWTMNRGDKTLMESHPDWYAKSRKGDSCVDKPPYVGYYRWLCPSKDDVRNYIFEDAKSILQKEYVDGIHLDYVRFCDVILPVNLWDHYHIEQTRELPEYDFCYCDNCKALFKQKYNIDLNEIKYPEASLSWRQFRYDLITDIVNEIAMIAKQWNKKVSAAVFPTPEVARRNVRQDWTNWNLSAVFPMTYHAFYKEEVSWVGSAVREGLHGLANRFPLYAGLYLPDFKNDFELNEAMKYALKNGAAGVSLYGDLTDNQLALLTELLKTKDLYYENK